MASSGTTNGSATAEATVPQDLANAPNTRSSQEELSSTPLEMTTLGTQPAEEKSASNEATPQVEETKHEGDNTQVQPSTGGNPTTEAAAESEPKQSPLRPELKQTLSTAIGPSSDQPIPVSKDTESGGPTLMITLLLTSGARHPFKLDAKYLNKRNVKVTDDNPFNLSVYTLKELILREWREEWEQKPSSPSSIRLISFGKLLDDKAPLSDSKFSHDSPNVVHMTIKPQEIVDEEDAKGTKGGLSRERDGNERSPGCRCVIL